ncbi:tetratricopeptide repeat protein [Candidatus Binatus sp.]|jgi:tetratricopeptide (TPR) repeat protein|uniref:tetratricopeptide repeat protein n=1 Tax=Candidatus Binatus sp. TaxID=2811406 RepID=UPI002FDB43EB
MRTAIVRALVLPVLLAIPFVSGCQSEAKRHLYKAEDLFEKRDLDGAKKELALSIKADPTNLDAHKSLAHIDEALGDDEGAAREYEAASALDPADQKLLDKARLYKQLESMANSSGKSLDDIKAGKVEGGVRGLKDIMLTTRIPAARQKAVHALADAIPIIEKIGDRQAQDKKYADAINTYEQGIRAAMLLARAHKMEMLGPDADPMMHKINQAAKAAGTPDAAFKLFNDVIGDYPDDKVANLELAQVYLSKTPPEYDTAADLEERGGAPDDEVRKLRDQAKKHRK